MKLWEFAKSRGGEELDISAGADVRLVSSESPSRPGKKIFFAFVLTGTLLFALGSAFHRAHQPALSAVQHATHKPATQPAGSFLDALRASATAAQNSHHKPGNAASADMSRMSGASLGIPLFFEANRGQSNPSVRFLARGGGYTLFVTPTETVLAEGHTTPAGGSLANSDLSDWKNSPKAILRMKLLDGNPSTQILGENPLPGKVNYLIGKDPSHWQIGVPLYSEVRSAQVYPGIDLVFHGNESLLEYDFVVSPGADPGRIRFKVSGANKLQVGENGDLVLRAAKTEFRMHKPAIYQQVGSIRRAIDGGFAVTNGNLVAFNVAPYDKSQPLTIDPTFTFTSFIGGNGVEVSGGADLDMTNPASLRYYISGATTDLTTFPETKTTIGVAPGAANYSFVAKVDPTTTGAASLNYLTFIGGSVLFGGGTGCQNLVSEVKLDISGGAGQVEPVLLGETNCQDFPVTSGGPTTGTDDVFITRLLPSGTALDNSTLFGGSGSVGLAFGGGVSLFVSPEGNVVVSGNTTSTNLPATTGAYSPSFNNGTTGSFDDCYVAEFDRSFNIVYLTYMNVGIGSTNTAPAMCGVGGVDAAGKIYAGGTTVSSTAFNLANGGTGANGFQKTFVGTPGTTPNSFLVVFDPSLSGLNQLFYSTYYAGGGGTIARAGAVDIFHGLILLGGDTFSNSGTNAPDIPLVNAYQSTDPTTSGTGFVAVVDTTKTGSSSLVASSYLGGTGSAGGTSVRSVAFDPQPGNPPTLRIVVGGQTTAASFPTLNPLQSTLVGSQNAFVSVLTVPNSGSNFNMAPLFSTFLGGGVTVSGESESIRSLVTDSNHNVYALGRTASSNFFGNTSPATTVNGFQTTCTSCNTSSDVVMFVLAPQSGTNVPDLTITKSHSGNFTQGQTGATYSITVKNSGAGPTIGTVRVTDSLPAGLTATGISGTNWNCSLATLTCTRSDALAANTAYPEAITLTVNVSAQAPPSVINSATVSGGSETNVSNNTATDVTTINPTVGACTDNYIGANNGHWGTATNWSTGNVPGASDVACIPSSTTVLLDTSLPVANQTIKGLNSSGTLTISVSPLTVTGNSLANVLNISGGALVANGQLTVSGPVTMTSGTFGGTGEIDLQQLLTVSGGFLCSIASGASCGTGTNAVMNANAGITLPAGGSVVVSNRTVNVSGTTTWAAGTLSSMSLQNGAIVNNTVGSTWSLGNDGSISFAGGAAVAFNNAGVFQKTAGTNTSNIGVPFNNTGTVNGNSGTLSLAGGGSCSSGCPGSYIAGSSGTISFAAGIFTQTGPISGSGTVNFNGGTVSFGSGDVTISATTVNILTAAIGGPAPGVLNFATRPNWSGGFICSNFSGTSCAAGSNATVNFNAGVNFPSGASTVLYNRTANISGTTTWSGSNGTLTLEQAAVVNIPPTGVWNYTNDGTLSFGGGAPVAFNNEGTFEKTGGTGNTSVTAPFNNQGTVLGTSGTLAFSGGGNCGSFCPGTFTSNTGGTIDFNANIFAQSGPINGTGIVNFDGAAMNFGTGTTTISAATVNQTAGVLAGAAPGDIVFATPLNWSGGFICSVLSGVSCSTGSNATVSFTAGVNFPSGANVALFNRTANISGTATWSGSLGALSMGNGAIINIPNTGTWNLVNDSNVSFSGGTAVAFNNAGNFEKTGGTGTSTISVPFNNTGTVNGNSAILTFSAGGNCTSSCPGTFSAGIGGTIDFGGGIFAQTGPIIGNGTVNFDGATMDFGTGSTTISAATVNLTTGTLGGASPGTITFSTPLNWTSGFICSTLNGTACLVSTNATVVASAGINFPANANTVLSSRTLNVPGNVTWSGTSGNLSLENGAIINLSSTGVWNYANDSALSFAGGNAVAFNNSGNFEKTAGTGTTNVSVPFNNSGTVNGNSGILAFNSGGGCGSTCAGTYSAGTGGTVSFVGGTFLQSGPISGLGTVNFNGANLDFGTGSESITASTVNFSAGLVAGSAPGTITFANQLIWTGGNMCSTLTTGSCTVGTPATTLANGGILFPSNAQLALNNRNLTTSGTTTWSSTTGSGEFVLENAASVTNKGTWDFQNDSFVYLLVGTPNSFTNSGTLQKSGGTTTTTTGGIYGNDGTFNNSGHVSALVGQLNINGSDTSTGTWAVSSGAFLNFGSAGGAGTFNMSGPFTGAGTVLFSGDIENITGNYNITGATTVNGGNVSWLTPATVTGVGALNIASGSALFSSGNPVTAATMNFTGGSLGGTDTLTVTGASTWTGGTMCTVISTGNCAAPSGPFGTTATNGGLAFSGNSQITLNGRILNTAGTSAWTMSAAAPDLLLENGSIINNSGTWDIQNDAFVYLLIGASNTFNNNGTFQKSGGTSTATTGVYGTDGVFNNAGHVSALVGLLNMNGGGTGAGTWAASSGAVLEFGSAGGTGTFALSGPFSGAGTVNFNSNTENLTGNYNVTGSTVVNGGVVSWNSPATITSLGQLSITNGAANFSTGVAVSAPSLNMSGGNLAGPDTVTITGVTTWTAGTMCTTLSSGSCTAPTGPQGTTATNGGISIPGNGQLTLNGRILNTSGTTAFTMAGAGPDILLENGATINNSGLWDIQNDGFAYLLTGASNTFNNNGIFQKSGGTTTTTTSGIFGTDGVINNTGQFIAKAGQLNFNAPFTQTAGSFALLGGQLNTTSPLNINGGMVFGSGAITGGISDASGVVAPGTTTPSVTTGTLALGPSSNGTYSQGGSGAFNVKLGGKLAGQFDSLTVSGAVTLSGTLNVSLINGYTPVAGDSITIISAGSVGGAFASTNFPALGGGLSFKANYNPTTVVLSVVSVSTPVASLSTPSLTFPNTIINTSSPVQKVTLQNTGTGPLTITSIQPTGTDASSYTYTPDATLPCPISPATLTNGASCVLDVAMTPKTAGIHNSAQITVTDNSGGVVGSTQAVNLTGTAIALSSIAVTPVTSNLPVGGVSAFTAIGTYTDNSTQNLTDTATWASSNTAAATISNTAGTQGQAKGVAGGSTFITATQSGVTSNQASVTVTTATHFAVSSPVTENVGTPFTTTIFAEDQFNTVVPGYSGTVHFTSSDSQAVLPANSTLTNGTGSFTVTLKTQGSQTITATDTVTSSITGTSNPITVGSGTATHFSVSAPGTAVAGTPFSVTVTALDQFNNTAATYTGTVHFTSTDTQAVLPANSTLTSGTGTFSVTLKTQGSQFVTATDTVTSSITGNSNSITVGSGLATHFSVTAPASATVGTPISVTVTALDQFNNKVTTYPGTVHITSSDAQAVLPANSTLTSGTGTFSVTLKSLGSQTVTATDTVTSTISGTTGTITVGSGAATHFTVSAPASATAGTAFSGTVTALDQFNNTATGYTGTVHFTSSDTQAVLPANSTLTSGSGTFSFTLKTEGTQTVTATDTTTSTITGTSNNIVVGSATATHLVVTASPVATAGTPIIVSVAAVDQFGNLVPTYPGTVHFTSSDAQAVLPANSTLTSGQGSFSVTLKTLGGQTVTATDTVTSTITGISNTITVGSGVTTHFTVVATPTATAGSPDSVTIAALDQFGNLVTTYTGTVHFTSSDPLAVLPANSTLTNGAGVFSVTFKTLGTQTVTATDTLTSSITGTSNPVTVGSGVTTHFSVVAPGTATAGSPASVIVTALDQFNNPVTTYSGTVHFTSTDALAVLPANSTLTGGTGSFSVTFKIIGTQTVTARDTVTGTITGTSNSVSVTSGAATHFLVSSSATTTAGTAASVTVTALDQFNNVATGYSGTVHFTSTDAQATLPANSTLSSGTGTFSVTFKTVGSQTVTATDTVPSSITGTSGAITVQLITASFSGLTPSQSIAAGTSSVTLGGVVGNGTQFPPSGETVSITINGSSHPAAIGANGVFALAFPTATIAVSATPYTITYSYVSDGTFTGATNTSTTLTVNSSVLLQTITIAPATPTLAINGILPLVATGIYNDGSTQNLTSAVTWGSGTPSVATITPGGVATGVAAGTSNISATLGAVIGSTLLNVTSKAPFAYAGDVVSANCCLDVIDTTTNKIVATIPVTNVNEPLGLTPDQTRVYVPDNAANVVDVIDTTTNTLVTTIPIGNGTTAVAITPNGKFGYISDFGDNNIPVFSVATNTQVATIPVGFPTGWLTATPDGAFVYAGSAIDGRVAVVNTATNTLSTTFTLTPPAGQPVPGCITGPTFNNAGTLAYFAQSCLANSTSPGTVSVVSIPGNAVVTSITVGTDPFQTILTPDGSHLYVANAISNTVSVVDTSTNTVTSTITLPKHPESLAVTPDGKFVYVADTGSAVISVIQTSTNTVTTSIATTVPFGIVISSPPAASQATTLSLTPPNVIFASQPTGSQSVSQPIIVKNPGTSAVTLSSVLLTGPNAADFKLNNTCPVPPATLLGGASCSLQIASAPTVNGPLTALVTINSTNGIASSTQSAPLSGTGITLVSIAVTPANPSVAATGTVQFTATGTYNDNSTQVLSNVTWASGTLGVAMINSTGLATGVSPGTSNITATLGNVAGSTMLTVTPLVTFPLNVTLIGTGTGTVTDGSGAINCVLTTGVTSGTCTANYAPGTVVNLTASPTQPSTFGGWFNACTGTGGCSLTMNSAQSVTASFVPPPKQVPVAFNPGTNVTGAAHFCPTNTNPCTDTANEHELALNVAAVGTPFTVTLQATEVPPTIGNGICENGLTAAQDFDCRFKSFFSFQTLQNADKVVPLCYPYANGNCIFYSVFLGSPGNEPDPSTYTGPVNWNITFNNGTFVPTSFWAGSIPRLYDNPDGFTIQNSPYGTNCNSPMLIGNPGVPTNPAIFCQFVFDITTSYNAGAGTDPGLGGRTRVFNDVVVAFPPTATGVGQLTVTSAPDSATVTVGAPLGITFNISNSAAGTAKGASLNDPLPAGDGLWSISPPYTGPGTCSITGPLNTQVLNCAFGDVSASASFSLHIVSPTSSVGFMNNAGTVTTSTQQLLTITTVTVQPVAVAFSKLTPSQSIAVGSTSITLGGVIGNGTQFPPSGETVSVTINGVKQSATIGSNGAFSLSFPTATFPASATPYPITYSYPGDAIFSTATDNSTTLTVNSLPPGVNLSTSVVSSSVDGSGNYVFTIKITNNGGSTANATTVKSAVLATVVGTTRLNTATTTTLPINLGNIASLSSVTTTLTFPASAGPPNTSGAISLGMAFTGGTANSALRATLP